MFKTIIWATDGSELADGALPFALALAARDGAELIVLHVNALMTGRAAGFSAIPDDEVVRSELEARAAKLRADGVDARFEVVTAMGESVASAIADAAELAGADLIVIGTHAPGAIGTVLHGSVTKKLIHRVGCPVLAVPVTHLAHRTTVDAVAAVS